MRCDVLQAAHQASASSAATFTIDVSSPVFTVSENYLSFTLDSVCHVF